MIVPTHFGLLITAAASLTAHALPGMTRPEVEFTPSSPFETLSVGSATSNLADPPVPFSITVNYTGDAQFQQAFLDGAAAWEAIIPFYIDGTRTPFSDFSGIVINAEVSSIDGPGNVLGSAGPTFTRTDSSGFVMTTQGVMTFDADDFSSPTGFFEDVVLHEMAHVIGIGTLWDNNGLYDPGAASVTDPNNGQTVGQYTGEFGLQGWRAEFDSGAAFVPVEKGGGGGTANGHWNEGDGGSATGYISTINGLDSRQELMTGWLNPNSFIGEVTLGSLRDLGYEVEVIPEPKVMLSLALGCCLLLRRRRDGFSA